MFQLAVDWAVATAAPMGHGHVYAPEDYVDAWVAVTDIRDWSPEALEKLKRHLGETARKANDDGAVAPYSGRGG
jgi:uncharacterized membrane protein